MNGCAVLGGRRTSCTPAALVSARHPAFGEATPGDLVVAGPQASVFPPRNTGRADEQRTEQ
jgi:hypothetical protein